MNNIKKLSAKQLASQITIARLSIEKYIQDENYKQEIDSLVSGGIGGFCVFNGSPNNTKNVIDVLQMKAGIPLLFCADFENGLPMRLTNGTEFPHAMALGKIKNSELVKPIAKAIAVESKVLGIHWNLAPVCDINSNEDNPIINIRSFGGNAEDVGINAKAYIEGTQSEKVLACAKHFPGHGDTDVDSHVGLPVLTRSKESIEKIELMPFAEAIKTGVKSIMVGHLSVPSIDNTGKPASVSKPIIDILKYEMNFKGIVLPDEADGGHTVVEVVIKL